MAIYKTLITTYCEGKLWNAGDEVPESVAKAIGKSDIEEVSEVEEPKEKAPKAPKAPKEDK
jgi:hypothetical protein